MRLRLGNLQIEQSHPHGHLQVRDTLLSRHNFPIFVRYGNWLEAHRLFSHKTCMLIFLLFLVLRTVFLMRCVLIIVVFQVFYVLRSPLSINFLIFQLRERPVKLLVHVLSDNSLFVDPTQLGYLLNLSLEHLHWGTPLELFHFVKYLVAQRLANTLHELLHLVLGVHEVIYVEVQVFI